jgi:rhodanese-related sulfurtransferase
MLSGMRVGLCGIMAASLFTGCCYGKKICRGTQADQANIQSGNNPEGKKMNGEAVYPAISRADLSEKVKVGAITLVDANGSESYAEGHIPGSLDFESFGSQFPQGLPKDLNSPIVVYCGGPRCGAWKGAATALSGQGYTRIFHYPGGLMEWTEAGMLLEKGAAPVKIREIPISGDRALIPSILSSSGQEAYGSNSRILRKT